MGRGVVVRDLAEGDLVAWRGLWDCYNAFYGRSGTGALPEDVVVTTWRRLHDAAVPVHGLAAEAEAERVPGAGHVPGGALVGIAHYLFHHSTNGIGPACYLQDLFTAEDARGRGVGRALVDEVAVRARAAGASRFYWQTHETNATARRLYDRIAERSGFIVYRYPL